jgi:hypothetical protein
LICNFNCSYNSYGIIVVYNSSAKKNQFCFSLKFPFRKNIFFGRIKFICYTYYKVRTQIRVSHICHDYSSGNGF